MSIQGCLCDCADPACYINDDFSNYFEVNSTAQVVQSQNCPDGVVQFNVKKPFSQFDQNPGLNREIVPFYKIEGTGFFYFAKKKKVIFSSSVKFYFYLFHDIFLLIKRVRKYTKSQKCVTFYRLIKIFE